IISEYLAERKRAGLSASSIKLIVVALKIFLRFLAGQGMVERDPAEALALPRIERYLPETLNELEIEQFLEKIDTKAPHAFRDRHEINNGAHLAGREKTCAARRVAEEHLSPSSPA